MFSQRSIKGMIFICLCVPMMNFAEDIQVMLPSNETIMLGINENDSVQTIKRNIEEQTGYSSLDQLISVEIMTPEMKTYEGYRNYYDLMTDSDKKELYFIMKTLALKSLLELAKYKSKLEKSGDRIDHLHPLNFLAAIFTDEELKAYVHAIRKRGGMVWDKFIGGFSNTMDEEYRLDNLSMDLFHDFSHRVGIDSNLIASKVQNREWADLVKLLILIIPRDSDADRYDM